jgi:hypothetical protein
MAGPLPYARSSTFEPNRTLAGLILRQGEQSAQNWQNVGNTIAGSLRDIATNVREAPIRRQQEEAGQIQLENARSEQTAARQATEDRGIMRSAQSSRLSPDEVKAQLQQLGRGDLVPIYEKAHTELESSRLNLQKLRTDAAAAESDYFGGLAAAIKRANYDPLSVEWALSEAESDGHDVASLRETLKAQPAQLQTIVEGLIERSPKQRDLSRQESDLALRRDTEARAGRQEMATAADRERDDRRAEATLAETVRSNKEQAAIERTKAGQTALGSSFWAKDPSTGQVRRMTEQEARAVGAQQPDTADMRNKERSKATAARAVDAVRNLGSKILTRVGPAQRADAIKRGVEAVFGTDPEFRTYQDSRMALAGTLAVEQQGSRVSDADVKALWLPMVPDAYRDTKDSNDLKWELIDLMRGKEPAAGGGGGSAVPKEGETKPIPGYPGTEQTFKGGKWVRTK